MNSVINPPKLKLYAEQFKKYTGDLWNLPYKGISWGLLIVVIMWAAMLVFSSINWWRGYGILLEQRELFTRWTGVVIALFAAQAFRLDVNKKAKKLEFLILQKKDIENIKTEDSSIQIIVSVTGHILENQIKQYEDSIKQSNGLKVISSIFMAIFGLMTLIMHNQIFLQLINLN